MSDLVPYDDETPVQRMARLQAEVADAQDRAAKITAEAEADRPQSAANLPAAQSLPATEVKAQMARQRADLLHAHAEVKSAVDAVKSEIEAQRRAMEAQMRDVLAQMEPMKERVRQMEEGIWTVNLYLGRDEEINLVLDGEPAPADTPLSLRQMVLFMDEETAMFPESGGLDFQDIDVFVEWLTNPVHLNTLLPETKGVVAVKPRRTEKAYTNNAMIDAAMNEENKTTYFVIRNGGRVYVHRTDFNVGKRLSPGRDEFTSFFRTTRRDHTGQQVTEDLEPGTDQWLRAEKAAGAVQRHYMRVAMILQGLIDRTVVFHPLPDGGLSTLHPEAYESGAVVLISDEEMSLGTGREPYYDWVRRLNRELRPGMRIIGAFNHSDWREMRSHDRYSYDEHPRLTPRRAASPESHVIHYLEGRRGGGFTFKYVRNEQVWGRNARGYDELRAPKNRATATILPDDPFIIPLDLVTVEQMREYMGARTERHAYMDMMPLLEAAVAVKEIEAEAEAPFRDLITSQIAATYGADLTDDLTRQVQELIDWWKHTNRTHRPLVASDVTGATDEAKALRMIVAEWDSRRRSEDAGDPEVEAAAVTRLRAEFPDLMFIGRARTGKIVAFAPQPSAFPAEVSGPAVFVQEVRATVTGRGKTEVRDWVLPGSRASRLRTLFETDEWAGWDRAVDANCHLSDVQIAATTQEAVDLAIKKVAEGTVDRIGRTLTAPRAVEVIGVTHSPRERTFTVYLHPTDLPFDPDGTVTTKTVSAQYLSVTYSWTLKGGQGLPVLTRKSSAHAEAWRTDPFTKGQPLEVPWHVDGARYNRPGLVRFDQGVFDRAMADRATVMERSAAASARSAMVGNAFTWLERQWNEQVEAEAYARFIDDYADPTLWEGHRKTLKLEALPLDRARSNNGSDAWARGGQFFKESFWTALTYLVDRWVDVDGLTVAEFVDLAVEHGAERWEMDERIAGFLIRTESPITT